MRKAQKDQIKEFLELLKEAYYEIKKAIYQEENKRAMELLKQCREGAVWMESLIEKPEHRKIIFILEKYQKLLDRIYQIIEQSRLEEKDLVDRELYHILIELEERIEQDIKVRLEMVFLPYKASMWDSLESIWKEADTDPACEAYVIPIPYFDKNPDGSFREEHYEGDQYPKNVPITRYDEYDLEAHHPDIIYIHNPYDECNHVTSVHPHFYARNLRNYTDKLVYIPYFVLEEIDPGNQAVIDGMKHFCFMPGTIYAHQVIVQSEDMRQIYINEYMKAAKEMGLLGEHVDQKFLEKKFLGTGSPKIDKVLNTKREDLEIPEEWLRIMEKPDGSWKKVVFYNVGVSALLHDEYRMLEKMESVFNVCRRRKNEVTLLWRPHPLIQATIESMRPQLWEAYREIRDRYIAEGWGIYDDSADMDRAIVLSDAYYGVGSSSVVQVYQRTGKPVLIWDITIK